MSENAGEHHWVMINRAPVLTLWATEVARRLGFRKDEALTMGRAVAGLNAYAKGKSLGLFKPSKKNLSEKRDSLAGGHQLRVELLNRAIPAVQTRDGLRALSKGQPVSPESVQRYLESKFGDRLPAAQAAMAALAKATPPATLRSQAYHLYEQFRPVIPAGKKGWGAAGRLSLDRINELAEQAKAN